MSLNLRETNNVNREHGVYVSERSEQLLLFSARGPWNDEIMHRGVLEMAKYIAQFDHSSPWGQISCLYGESLMPPSTYAGFEKQTLVRKKKGLSAIAVVIKNSDVKLTIRHQLSRAYTKANIEHRFLDSVEDAIDWQQTLGIPFNQAFTKHFFNDNKL